MEVHCQGCNRRAGIGCFVIRTLPEDEPDLRGYGSAQTSFCATYRRGLSTPLAERTLFRSQRGPAASHALETGKIWPSFSRSLNLEKHGSCIREHKRVSLAAICELKQVSSSQTAPWSPALGQLQNLGFARQVVHLVDLSNSLAYG